MEALARTLADWIAIPSVSGAEDDYGDALAREASRRGFDVERQELAPGRTNLLVRAGAPRVVLCTHLDTVPPWFGPRVERRTVHGRGACDAKGPALAMLCAAERLLGEGRRDVGLLFTVGEETDSAGARLANERLAEPWRPAFTILGEPTDNRFVAGHKGVLKASLRGHGVASHSSEPKGPSAVHALVRALAGLLERDWGSHPLFGRGTLNVGTIRGGVADNVVADAAEARLMLRLVEEPERALARLREALVEDVELELDKAYGPLAFRVPEGEGAAPVVAFATDGPFLTGFGEKLLFGPGSIRDAHTDHERLDLAALEEAVAVYARTARDLAERAARGGGS